MRLTIPNLLTWLRIALIPIFVVVYYLPFSWSSLVCALLFALAGITDWFDGFLARRWQQTSAFGAFLDPVADKLMVATALVLLVQSHASPWMAVPAAIIIGREITVSALREWMAELGKRAAVAVSWMGKLKTGAQMVAIVLLLFHQSVYGLDAHLWGIVLLTLAAVLTLWSMVLYLKAALPVIFAGAPTTGEP